MTKLIRLICKIGTFVHSIIKYRKSIIIITYKELSGNTYYKDIGKNKHKYSSMDLCDGVFISVNKINRKLNE